VRAKWFIIADNFQKEKHTMSVKKLISWAGVLTLIAAVLAMIPAATQAQSGNLLQNPGFEQPYTDNQQANGWGRYRITIEKPEDASALQYSNSANFSAEVNPSGKFPELCTVARFATHWVAARSVDRRGQTSRWQYPGGQPGCFLRFQPGFCEQRQLWQSTLSQWLRGPIASGYLS
jgi:hypothetical protein